MDFEIVEVYMFNKAVLCETSLAEFFKVIYVDIKPCRYLNVEGMTGLIQCGKNLLCAVHIRVIIADYHITYKMIVFNFFYP